MLHKLLQAPVRIEASPGDEVHSILEKCGNGLRSFSFHLNCTHTSVFPICRSELIDVLQRTSVAVLNGTATNASKRFLQSRCLSLGVPSVALTAQADLSPSTLIIVKTNLNFGGYPERKLSVDHLAMLDIKLPSATIGGPLDYVVLRSEEIPSPWWDDDTLMMERFISNTYDRQYRVYFAGQACCIEVLTDPAHIKKYARESVVARVLTNLNALAASTCGELPTSLQIGVAKLINSLGLDFGALDVVEDDNGVCYIIDLNTTTFGQAIVGEAAEFLREGLMRHIGAVRSNPTRIKQS